MCPTAAPVSASSLTLLSLGRFFSGLAAELAVGQSKEHPWWGLQQRHFPRA